MIRIDVEAAPPFYKNGYLVSCQRTGEAVLIDPGDEVEALVRRARVSGVHVVHILLTHAHLDHITGVSHARDEFGVKVWLHHADLFLYQRLVEQGQMFGLTLQAVAPPDAFYDDAPLLFGDYVVDVKHTPGHCPGGVCLAIGRRSTLERELFVGDTLFAGSIGRTDLPGGDLPTLVRSIRQVLFSYPDETAVHPGHGPATTIGVERRSNPFLLDR